MVSTKWTISRAETTRDSRKAIWECFWYQRASKYMGTAAASTSRPLRQSRAKTVDGGEHHEQQPEASELTPESRSSRSASRSEVCRAMIRPEVYFSWNSRLSRWVCRKTRTRRSSSIAWLSRAVDVTYRAVRPAVDDAPRQVGGTGQHQRQVVAGAQRGQGAGRSRTRSGPVRPRARPGTGPRRRWSARTAAGPDGSGSPAGRRDRRRTALLSLLLRWALSSLAVPNVAVLIGSPPRSGPHSSASS